MTSHAYFELAFAVTCCAALGGEKKEPVVVELPSQEPVVFDFQEGTDYVLSVGMPLDSAIDILDDIGLPAVDDQSAHSSDQLHPTTSMFTLYHFTKHSSGTDLIADSFGVQLTTVRIRTTGSSQTLRTLTIVDTTRYGGYFSTRS